MHIGVEETPAPQALKNSPALGYKVYIALISPPPAVCKRIEFDVAE